MAKDAILFRPRTKDTTSGVTRKTLRRLAKLLDVPESEVIHKALASYARENLPRYEPDDGPLTSGEHQDVGTRVRTQHGRAKVVEALRAPQYGHTPKLGSLHASPGCQVGPRRYPADATGCLALERTEALSRVRVALRRSRVVALVGPRQCGKTTLAREIVPVGSQNYFDLEDPVSIARLAEPVTALRPLRGIVVIDEVQRREDLFPVLRVLVDRKPAPARFLVLGSASPGLLRQSSETLAGRIETITLGGFTLGEVGSRAVDRHWLRGGFPRSFLARSNSESFAWRQQFMQTFLERDVPQLGIGIAAAALLRFWNMVAHYHGQVWNAAEPARSLGVSEPSVRRYLDLLTGLFMVRRLAPWHENLGKRQVKAPKV